LLTTCEPGAIEVFTHGLTDRPFSTALRASRAAPSITDGFEVLVHDVIEAITTAPWSSSNSPRSSEVTFTGWDTLPCAPLAADCTFGAGSPSLAVPGAIGSLAGNDSSEASSIDVCGVSAPLVT